MNINQEIMYPGLEPWEPLITGKRDYMVNNCVADDGDICGYCHKELLKNTLIVSGCNTICCSWQCALKIALKYPDSYYIHHTGAY